MSAFASSIRSWFQSWKFIFENGLVHFFLYPIVISVLLSMGSLAIIGSCVSFVMDFIGLKFDIEPLNGGFWQNIQTAFSGIAIYATAFVFSLIAYYLFFRVQKYLVLILMSPVMALLSARVDEVLTGTDVPLNTLQFVKDIIRGILLVVRNFLMELALTMFLWFVTFYLALMLPVSILFFAPLASIISFFIGAYYFGFSVMDYRSERHKLSVKESISFVRRNKEVAIGIGAIFAILFWIPFVGVSIATITCTVAAMLAIVQKSPGDNLTT